MKKSLLFITLILSSLLIFGACGSDTKPTSTDVESTEEDSTNQEINTSSGEEEEKQEDPSEKEEGEDDKSDKQETYYKSENGVIEAEYFVNEPFPIITENGITYFDFTPDEIIKNTNKIITEKTQKLTPYSKISDEEMGELLREGYVGYENEVGAIILIKTDESSGKVLAVVVGGTEKLAGESGNVLTQTAIESSAVITALDPNMTPQYAAFQMMDVAMAGMITYGDDLYASSTVTGQVGYGVVKIGTAILGEEGDFVAFSIIPLSEEEALEA